MRYVEFGPRRIPIVMKKDVIVVGGGTAGVTAAIAAARNGAKTAVIEALNCLGGSQTAGLVTPLVGGASMNLYDTRVKGINLEMINRVKEVGEVFDGVWHNPETLKLLFEKMVTEAGVELLYNTVVIDTIVKDRKIEALILYNKSGLQAASAKVFIDATGDADVAVKAGCECMHGRTEDGLNQAPSLRFMVGNVDIDKLAEFLQSMKLRAELPKVSLAYTAGPHGGKDLQQVWEKAVKDGELTEEEAGYIQFTTMDGLPGVINFNCPEIKNVDCTDAESLTRAIVKGRKMAWNIFNFFKKHIPGFEDACLLLTAPLLGVRESRRIVGRYVLTSSDVLKGRKFPDGVVRSWYGIDIHIPDRVGVFLKLTLQPGDYYEIPYRCLVPKDIDNLLVTGRCISSDFEANSGLRIQSVCRGLGEAAGTAAALCVSMDTTPPQLDVSILIKKLSEQGVL